MQQARRIKSGDLISPATRIVPDPHREETRFRAVTKNAAGRYVFVVFCYVGDAKRPISARYMHDKEIRRYEQTR